MFPTGGRKKLSTRGNWEMWKCENETRGRLGRVKHRSLSEVDWGNNVEIGKCENVKIGSCTILKFPDHHVDPSRILPRSGYSIVARGKATKERHPGLEMMIKQPSAVACKKLLIS